MILLYMFVGKAMQATTHSINADNSIFETFFQNSMTHNNNKRPSILRQKNRHTKQIRTK